MKLRLIKGYQSEQMNLDADSSPLCGLELHNLVVNYDSLFSLECSDLSLRGNIIGIIGHNGAGKSTLIKSILDLLPIKHGSINAMYYKGAEARALLPERDMAFCPETGAVFADISVENYIKLWCRIKQRDELYYRKSGSQYIDMLNLEPLLSKLGRELSKGQRRRVQTAIGFLTSPKLFLFDEPFDGLDVQKTHELTEIISKHNERMTFIITSHRMDVMERLADSLIVLKEGRIICSGAVSSVAQALAGTTIQIGGVTAVEHFMSQLRVHEPDLLLNRFGSDIYVTGKGLERQNFSLLLNQLGFRDLRLEEATPSLVEAMNYHLRSSEL